MLAPKPPLLATGVELPKVKGARVILLNMELLVPLLVVCVVAPKLEEVVVPKEKPVLVLPNVGCVLAGVPKEVGGFAPPKAG